jgi:hypothetical protein
MVRSVVMFGKGQALSLLEVFTPKAKFVGLFHVDMRTSNENDSSVPPPTENLLKSFTPCYPDKLWMEEQAFCNAFPFHIVFDKQVRQLVSF